MKKRILMKMCKIFGNCTWCTQHRHCPVYHYSGDTPKMCKFIEGKRRTYSIIRHYIKKRRKES